MCVTFPLVLEKDSRGTNVSLWSWCLKDVLGQRSLILTGLTSFLEGSDHCSWIWWLVDFPKTLHILY